MTLAANKSFVKKEITLLFQVSKDLSEEYERLVNPEKALEDSKPPRIKEEPMSDISFPVSEEPEADLASGDQALPMGVLGAHGERLASGLDADHSPHTSGSSSAALHLYSALVEPFLHHPLLSVCVCVCKSFTAGCTGV